jgi:hypothetical protein
VLSPNARWTLQRIALLDSPLLMIAAVASLVTDRPLLGLALALLSFAFFMAGRETIGQRHGPGQATTPLERSRRRREPRAPSPRTEEPGAAEPATPGALPAEDTGATSRRRRRRDFKGF